MFISGHSKSLAMSELTPINVVTTAENSNPPEASQNSIALSMTSDKEQYPSTSLSSPAPTNIGQNGNLPVVATDSGSTHYEESIYVTSRA